MSALNNARKNGPSLTLREDELLAERVGNYLYLHDKIFKDLKGEDAIENAWQRLLRN